MNQTGGLAKRTQSATQKQRTEYNQTTAPQTLLNPDNYVEKPRPNFYNVLKNIHESRSAYKRVLYVAKLNETEIKGEVEKDMTSYFKNIYGEQEFSGLNLILGSYCIHLLEGENVLVNMMLKTLNDYQHQSNSPYHQIWILHQTEECPNKVFSTWLCKNVILSGSTKEVKNLQQHEKSWVIYESMLEIGKQINIVINKGTSQINQTIKNMASELLPIGEELQSCLSDTEMTLNEYLQFITDPPDIILEKELVWPVEPDLIY
ncbi:UNKNOWN [Stylonychia lemnae]|uniref:BLUF domain-containing protein n=1 Tax=Stylonychia lemnae TaxID=5949 RepID=A0A078A0D0_STYLE|nr:UNKNOWN [Stylonychia lemnae]|eukprot:CDW74898.1 UNKNOWN [Stylonychia lemnae]